MTRIIGVFLDHKSGVRFQPLSIGIDFHNHFSLTMTFNSPGNKVIKCSLQEDHIYHKFQCPFTSSIHPWISLPPRKLHSSPPEIHPTLLGHEGTSGTPGAYISGPPKVIYINHHSTRKYMDQKHQNPNTTKGKASSQNIVSPVQRFLYHIPASA